MTHVLSRRSFLVIVVICAAQTIVACGGTSEEASRPTALDDDRITVGSFNFPESEMLGELYSQALERKGFSVERAFGLGRREFVVPALEQGLVEIVPEYAGTAAAFLSLGHAPITKDPVENHAVLVAALEGRRLVALAGAPAQDANTFVVTIATATRHRLHTLSDLQPIARQLRFGGPPECPTRPLCLAGLESVYELEFARPPVIVDAGGPVTRRALRTGDVDVALLFTSDPTIVAHGLVELIDDRDLQPAENVTPLVHAAVIERFGSGIANALDPVSEKLTTAELRELNAAVSSGVDATTAVARWLDEQGLT